MVVGYLMSLKPAPAASRQVIRFSLDLDNTADDVKAALRAITRAVKLLRG
jgi:cysteine sulfinate desulfinase/cysteine desulfurase-like protein